MVFTQLFTAQLLLVIDMSLNENKDELIILNCLSIKKAICTK